MLSRRTTSTSAAALSALALSAHTVAAEPWDHAQNWGIGIHLTALGLAPAEQEHAETFDMGGAGVQLRYRINHRWELEADIDHVGGELESGALARDVKSLLLGAMFHINPRSQWTWSIVAALGGGRDDIRFVDVSGAKPMPGTASFQVGQFELGVALERRFRSIGVAAQLRAVGVARNEEELDGPAFADMDVPTPRNESGGRFNLVVTYYF